MSTERHGHRTRRRIGDTANSHFGDRGLGVHHHADRNRCGDMQQTVDPFEDAPRLAGEVEMGVLPESECFGRNRGGDRAHDDLRRCRRRSRRRCRRRSRRCSRRRAASARTSTRCNHDGENHHNGPSHSHDPAKYRAARTATDHDRTYLPIRRIHVGQGIPVDETMLA